MIKRYTDHAANERTYLAWVRTAIAIMGFGFLVEKFDLFVDHLGKIAGDSDRLHRSVSAELLGVTLFVVGIAVVVSATLRFFMYKRLIEQEETVPYNLRKTNLVLSGLVVCLALFMAAYLLHQTVGLPIPPTIRKP